MWPPTSVRTARIERRKCSHSSTCAPASGSFLADQRNVVLFGGTGTGNSQLAIAIARALNCPWTCSSRRTGNRDLASRPAALYPRNAKIHGTDHVAKMVAISAKFDWTGPCTVGEDG